MSEPKPSEKAAKYILGPDGEDDNIQALAKDIARVTNCDELEAANKELVEALEKMHKSARAPETNQYDSLAYYWKYRTPYDEACAVLAKYANPTSEVGK